jgi:hypothetical protein
MKDNGFQDHSRRQFQLNCTWLTRPHPHLHKNARQLHRERMEILNLGLLFRQPPKHRPPED